MPRLRFDQEPEGERTDDEDDAEDHGHRNGDDAGGDGAVALGRVESVGLDVARVVEQVDAARQGAVGDERQHRVAEDSPARR